MILLATNKRDITTDYIVRELSNRNIPFYRLNTEDISSTLITIPDGDPSRMVLEVEGRQFPLSAFSAGYFRRPETPLPPSTSNSIEEKYVVDEWAAILRSIWNELAGKWLNDPHTILRAEDKPRQLSIACKAGFTVPKTLITNDLVAARDFAKDQKVIAKTLRQTLLELPNSPGYVVFTSLVDLSKADEHSFQKAPMIIQEQVEKYDDIRVTVVDDSVMAASIASQNFDETEVDWRRGSRVDIDHGVIELPEEISQQCVEVTRQLGLRFSAIDLCRCKDGKYWFFEANPNGQWAWIEERTGLPISAAIVGALLKNGPIKRNL